MIPREEIFHGIASSPLIHIFSELEEVKPTPRLREFFDFLSEAGVFHKKGDKYKKAQTRPGGGGGPLSEAVAKIFHEVVVPYVATGARAGRLSQELLRALYTYTSAYQPLRIVVAQEVLRYGGLTLVAGWFPCGFSSELMSVSGRDVVIVEERDEVLSLEADRLSLLPLAPSPLGQELAAASFYSFETVPLDELGQLVDKYGRFDAAVLCNRSANVDIVKKAADEIYVLAPRDRAVLYFNNLVLGGLGLSPLDEEFLKSVKKWEREEVGGFDVYVLRGAGRA
ncbi:MAG: hypothetical protein ABWK05_06230 [Pyrobaculum sp.]